MTGCFFFLSCGDPQQPDLPNIVMILADDLGYGDLGCYNTESWVPTPNLDALASEGMRFTRAYCPVSVCSPTRYSLMTGRYSWRSWKKSGVMANYEPSMINASLMTLPEMLQEAGYSTAGFGKWHLGTTFPTLDGEKPAGYGKFRADDNGSNLDLDKPVTDGPLDHGFDHWLGFSCASECWILKGDTIAGAIGHDLYTIEATPNQDHIEVIPLSDYLPYISAKTQGFLEGRGSGRQKQPFFLYFAPYVPHIPLAVSETFRGRTEAGAYGDYVHELDYYVGKLLSTLDSLGLKENTIVLFASDNGSQFRMTSNQLGLAQATNSPADVLVDQDTISAHRPNGTLRGTKWSIYEGGVRTPFLARWPGHISGGTISHQMIALNDVMATVAEVIGFKGAEKSAIDSHSFLPVLEGIENQIREEIVVQSSGRLYGIVQGKWKYVSPEKDKPQSPEDPKGELYDLSTDESESTNLYNDYPEVAGRLKNRLEELTGDEVIFDN